MAYKDFTIRILEDDFGLKIITKKIFFNIPSQIVSDFLSMQLERGLENPLISEKAIGENIISPILTEIKQINKDKIEFFSGVDLKADKSKGLNGECDFILTNSPYSIDLNAPIFCITEAKKGDINNSKSLAQCISQLLGARIFNEKNNKNISVIYGAVSVGTEWIFLKLENDIVLVDTNRYGLLNLPQLLGILQYIVDISTKHTN